MSHSVNQPTFIKCLLCQNLLQISADLFLILPILYVLFDILYHLNDLDVCPAVFRPFQRAQRRGNRRIGICAGGGNHPGRKSRIVAAAVFCMQYKGNIQNFCFEGSILTV